MIIARESYSESLHREILPLAQKCWDESTRDKDDTCAFYGKRDIQIEPDFDVYQAIDEAGNLIIYTARDDSRLVGYAIALLYVSPHHRKMKTANGDSIYLEPDYRVLAPVLVEKVMADVKEAGAVTLNWGVTKDGPMHELLKRFGFVADELIMERILCA